jgi:hypothetical protein
MRLPGQPSAEHLRKQAKRLAKAGGLRLTAAQHQLARDHGFANWAALMREVAARTRAPLAAAAVRGDAAAVEALLAAGAPVDALRTRGTRRSTSSAEATRPTRPASRSHGG